MFSVFSAFAVTATVYCRVLIGLSLVMGDKWYNKNCFFCHLYLFISLLGPKLSNISVLLCVCLKLCVFTQLCIFESDLYHSQLLFVGQIITMFLFLLLRPVLSTPNFHSPIRRWHSVHCLEETEAHLSPLVPPHYCAALLLVLLQGHGGWRRVVHDHELLGPCCHVLLLRTACSWFQAVTQVCHVHHTDPNHTDVDGLRSQLLGVLVDAAGPGVSIPHAEHCLVLPHVPQLLCALCPVLLWSLHRQVQIIGYGCHKEKRVKNKCHKYEKKEDNVKREFEIESRDQCLEKWMGLGVREVAYSPRSLVGVGGSWNGWCLCLSIITNVQVFKKNKIKKQKKNHWRFCLPWGML